jgi:hypothetical protein
MQNGTTSERVTVSRVTAHSYILHFSFFIRVITIRADLKVGATGRWPT